MLLHVENTFGVGLLGISREWPPDAPKQPPSPEEAQAFILAAYREGVRFFDMAPAYASGRKSDDSYRSAERTFGKTLAAYPEIDRDEILIATKDGEHYDPDHNPTYFPLHTEAALQRSLDQSIVELGTVPDILFVHKATKDLFLRERQREELQKGLRYARTRGVKYIGASISDIETAQLVLQDSRFTHLQFPFSMYDTRFEPILRKMQALIERGHQLVAVINRPMGMGKAGGSPEEIDAAFAFIEQRRQEIAPDVPFVVLSGTSNPDHLQQNHDAFIKTRGRFSS